MNPHLGLRIGRNLFAIAAALACSVQGVAAKESSAAEERTLSFPVPKSIGTLYMIDPQGIDDDTKPVGAAFGTVKLKVPKGQWIKLVLNKEAFLQPTNIDRSSATGIEMLYVNFMTMDDQFAGVCDSVVAKAGHFKNLKVLKLSNSDATDAGVERISTMPTVERIEAAMTEITGKCFKNFGKQFPNLKSLLLWNAGVDNPSLQYLAECPKLAEIDFRKDTIDAVGFKNLCKIKNLTTLTIKDDAKIIDDCLKDLLPLKHLTYLHLKGTKVTAKGLKLLAPLHLKELSVSAGMVNAQDVIELKKISKEVFVDSYNRVNSENTYIFAPLKRH